MPRHHRTRRARAHAAIRRSSSYAYSAAASPAHDRKTFAMKLDLTFKTKG
jgi:hypothetical protein